MLKRLMPTPSMAVALLALFVAMGGVSYGVATGAIDSREIKNNSIKGTDIKNRSLAAKDLSSAARKSLKGNAGANGPQGPTGAAGTARAYGTVTSAGAVIAAESKGITATKLTADGPGRYCVQAPGVSSATHPIIVTPDHTDGSGADHTAVYFSGDSACKTSGGWRILTENAGAFTDIRFSVIIP